MKKILVLVASETNLPAIKAAKRMGYYVITCDNNEKNIGHRFADENIFIDVYDTERILEEIQNKQVDAVITFVSAHGLKSAAIISEKLKVNGYSPHDLEILLHKGQFRNYLKRSGLNCPNYQVIDNFMQVDVDKLSFPSIIKPVEEGGSKGVAVIKNINELESYLTRAKSQDKGKNFIIEDYLKSEKVINGDCIVQNGRVIASFIGDYVYDRSVSDVIPVATLFPSNYKSGKVLDQMNKIAEDLKIPNGIINFEAIIIKEEAHIIEVNPRPSGNYIWKLMEHHYMCDLAELTVKHGIGECIDKSVLEPKKMNSRYAYQLFYTSENQTFKKIDFPKIMQNSIIDIVWFYDDGETIRPLDSLYDRVGVALLELKDKKQYCNYFENLDYFRI